MKKQVLTIVPKDIATELYHLNFNFGCDMVYCGKELIDSYENELISLKDECVKEFVEDTKSYPSGLMKYIQTLESDGAYFSNDYQNDDDIDYFISAPTIQLVIEWLRTKNIDITLITNYDKHIGRCYHIGLSFINSDNKVELWMSRKSKTEQLINYKTTDEANLVAIRKSINILKI